jgi:hypothetical protein
MSGMNSKCYCSLTRGTRAVNSGEVEWYMNTGVAVRTGESNSLASCLELESYSVLPK